MKIFYIGQNVARIEQLKAVEESFIVLGWDKWDDFGYKTLLPSRLFVGGEEVEIPNVRVLIEGQDFTAAFLDRLIMNDWSGEFPIPGHNYVSLPSDIVFYKVIAAKSSLVEAEAIARSIRDASYIKNVLRDGSADQLIGGEGFSNSLLREGGSNKAFQDSWVIFQQDYRPEINDFDMSLKDQTGKVYTIPFKFNSEVLPYDVNVLIGENGIGKSYCLQTFVSAWLKVDEYSPNSENKKDSPFNQMPNFSKIILVSYSPFEEFILDLNNTNLNDKDAYSYYGFRQWIKDETNPKGRIGISRNLPSSDSVASLIKCIKEDEKYGFLPDWINKYNTIINVLKNAIEFDELGFALREGVDPLSIFNTPFGSMYEDKIYNIGSINYVLLDESVMDLLNFDLYRNYVDDQRGVIFLRDGKSVNPSSGQRLFSYIVINILGALKNNSLVIVDEPELFLHPTLEIKFISLMKFVLKSFNSKAVLATHSLVSVREVPAKCVHVIKNNDAGKVVVSPPFETFGGDVQRISSYVFGDKSVSKPFETWLNEKVEEMGGPEQFINALGDELNEELIIKINRIGR